LSYDDVEQRIIAALSPSSPQTDRAIKAWEVVAWFTIFNPFSDTDYYGKLDVLVDLIHSDADSLFMYLVTVRVEPCKLGERLLREMHKGKADAYKTYCEKYHKANESAPVSDWLFMW
jgi:hypothetical protein